MGFKIILLVSGLAIFTYGLNFFLKLKKIKKWSYTKTEIINLSIDEIFEKTDGAHIKSYVPIAEYEYVVNDNEYSSTNIFLEKKGGYCETEEEAKQILDNIMINSVAYYDPSNPSSSVLTYSVSKRRMIHYYLSTIFGLILIGLSIYFLCCF